MKLRILLTLVIGIFSTASTVAQTAPVPTVKSIKGRAFVKMAKEAEAEAKPLRQGDKLSIGQAVKCDKGCQEVRISVCRYYTKLILNSPAWVPIGGMNCKASFSGVRGGAPKGEGTAIVSPREFETIRPEAFSLKWASDKPLTKVSLLLKVNLGEELLKQKDIDLSKGIFDSAPLVLKLKEAQKAGRLSFVIILDEGNSPKPTSVRFNLIALEDQQKLNRDLEEVENETDAVLKSIARGRIFMEHELFTEAVQELEQSLASLQRQGASKKTLAWVTRLTIIANRFAYNDERVQPLCASSKSDKCTKRLCDSLKNARTFLIDCSGNPK